MPEEARPLLRAGLALAVVGWLLTFTGPGAIAGVPMLYLGGFLLLAVSVAWGTSMGMRHARDGAADRS